MQEVFERLGNHKCPAPLLTIDQAFVDQLGHSLPDRHDADLQTLRQHGFRRQRVLEPPRPIGDQLLKLILQLLVDGDRRIFIYPDL